MTVLMLSATAAKSLRKMQKGKHQLYPVALTNGKYILPSNVETEARFVDCLDSVYYKVVEQSTIAQYLPIDEMDTIEE